MADEQPSSTGRQWPRLALHGCAAFVSGAVISFRWQILSSHWPYVDGVRLADLAIVVLAAVAGLTGLFLCGRSRRPEPTGWLAAAVAFAAMGVHSVTGPAMTTGPISVLVAMVVGLALGGVLAAAAVGDKAHQVVVITLLMGGVVSGTTLAALFYSYGRDDWLLFGSAAALAATASLAALRRVRTRQPNSAQWPWGSLVVITSIGVGVWLVAGIRSSLLDELLFDIGRPSQRRADLVRDADHLAVLSVSVLIVLLVAVYAYRVGGCGLARWVIVTASLSYPIATLAVQGTEWLMAAVLVSAAAALFGAAAARWADRAAPWDAIALLVVGWMTYLFAVAGQARSTGPMPEVELLVIAMMTFAVGAGVGGLMRSRTSNGGGLVVNVLLGLSSLIFTLQVVRVLFPEPGLRYVAQYPIGVPVVMSGGAVLLGLLWGFGMLVDKVRRDVHAEAVGG